MLRFLEVLCLAVFVGGLWMVNPWLILVVGGAAGLMLVDRLEKQP